MSFFPQLSNKKLYKKSAKVQKVPVYYYKPSKTNSSRDTIPVKEVLYKRYFLNLPVRFLGQMAHRLQHPRWYCNLESLIF